MKFKGNKITVSNTRFLETYVKVYFSQTESEIKITLMKENGFYDTIFGIATDINTFVEATEKANCWVVSDGKKEIVVDLCNNGVVG